MGEPLRTSCPPSSPPSICPVGVVSPFLLPEGGPFLVQGIPGWGSTRGARGRAEVQWMGQPSCEMLRAWQHLGLWHQGAAGHSSQTSLAPVSASSGPAESPPRLPMTGASLVTRGCGLTRAPGHPWLPPSGPCLHLTLELQYPSYLPGQTPSNHCHADLTATCPPLSPILVPLLLFSTSLGLPPVLCLSSLLHFRPQTTGPGPQVRGAASCLLCPGMWSRTRGLCALPLASSLLSLQAKVRSLRLSPQSQGHVGHVERAQGPALKVSPMENILPGRAAQRQSSCRSPSPLYLLLYIWRHLMQEPKASGRRGGGLD